MIISARLLLRRARGYEAQSCLGPIQRPKCLRAFVLSQAVWDGILIAHQPDGNDYVSEGIQVVVSASIDMLHSGR